MQIAQPMQIDGKSLLVTGGTGSFGRRFITHSISRWSDIELGPVCNLPAFDDVRRHAQVFQLRPRAGAKVGLVKGNIVIGPDIIGIFRA